MRLAMAQMKMGGSWEENLAKTLEYIRRAAAEGAQLIFFPEIQLSPFFPQYEKRDAEPWAMELGHPAITAIREACRREGICASPNIYLKQGEQRYDASLMIGPAGGTAGDLQNGAHRPSAVFLRAGLLYPRRRRLSGL